MHGRHRTLLPFVPPDVFSLVNKPVHVRVRVHVRVHLRVCLFVWMCHVQDLNAVIWLEDYLVKYKGTVLVVSHDQDFLAAVTTDIIHLEDQKLHYYRGDFYTFKKMHFQHREKLKRVGTPVPLLPLGIQVALRCLKCVYLAMSFSCSHRPFPPPSLPICAPVLRGVPQDFEKQEKQLKALKAGGKSSKQASEAMQKKSRESGGAKARKKGAEAGASGGGDTKHHGKEMVCVCVFLMQRPTPFVLLLCGH